MLEVIASTADCSGVTQGAFDYADAPNNPLTPRSRPTFFEWFENIRGRLDRDIDESALGTGYEELLRARVYQRLGIHPLVAERELPHQINFATVLS